MTPHENAMSPAARAEKIFEKLSHPYGNSGGAIEWIAAEINDAVKEAVREAVISALEIRDRDVKIAVDNGFKMQAEAYEDAAKIAGDPMTPDYVSDEEIRMRGRIARMIRAKANKLGLGEAGPDGE